jgi:aminocarboxymuconate-semialdehyde decarboxylase
MVAGKRVKTIDVHAHCHFREAGALLGADAVVA